MKSDMNLTIKDKETGDNLYEFFWDAKGPSGKRAGRRNAFSDPRKSSLV